LTEIKEATTPKDPRSRTTKTSITMGAGASSQITPGMKKRAKKNKRSAAKDEQAEYEAQIKKTIAEKFDGDGTKTLDRAEVRHMCETLMHDSFSPILGTVTDAEIDRVMAMGDMTKGPNEEITVDDIPTALSTILAIQSEHQRIDELFHSHDSDGSKTLEEKELRLLLTEVNEGIMPTDEDIKFVIEKCAGVDKVVDENEIRNAITLWYVLADEHPLPTTREEALALGYTDEQIQHFIEEHKEPEVEAEPTKEQLEAAVETMVEEVEKEEAAAADPAL